MIKENKGTLIITSLIVILPSLLSVGKGSGIAFVAPLFLLGVHWLCVFATALDPRNKGQNRKVFRMIMWACPVISLFCWFITDAMHRAIDAAVESIFMIFTGLLFVMIGNYLPKCKQNFTIGIRLPWTLKNEENWNKTHRLGGRLWVVCGFLIMLLSIKPGEFAFVLVPVLITVMVLIPSVYSWRYAKKQKENGTYEAVAKLEETEEVKKYNRNAKRFSAVILPVTIIFVCVTMFTGDITYECGSDELEIEATFWNDVELPYEEIDELELRDTDKPGKRVGGFGSSRLLMGNFKNDEFGYYTRYSYTGNDACIVLTVNEKKVVIGCSTDQETKTLYEELESRISAQ